MKLSLVGTQGKAEGKTIPVTLSQFLIGRDPQCHLRPASPLISKRHCALLLRGTKAFVRDFASTNGTFVNDQRVQGEFELHDGDRLRMGPLVFVIRLETTVPVSKPTPLPPPKAPAEPVDDESVAAMLLELQDDGGGVEGITVTSEEIPTTSTIMELPAPAQPESQEGQPAGKKNEPAKAEPASTSLAAKAILDKYTRRPRT